MIKNEIPAYDTIFQEFFNNYAQTTGHLSRATPEEVAQVIYEAATDESEQLRYVIGADAQFYIDTKTQHADQDYMRRMRNYFIKK